MEVVAKCFASLCFSKPEYVLGSAYFKNVQTPLNVDLILKFKLSHLHPVHKLKKKAQDPLSKYFLHLKVKFLRC